MTTSMSNYGDALRLELSIVEALLKRSRSGHSKAKYFQRTSMAIRAIQRCNLVEFHTTATDWKENILEQNRASKRKRDDDLWDLQSIQKGKSVLLDTKSIQTLHGLHKSLQQDIPDAISRIEYASEPLFLEISRGFFLPFCTVALGCLGRLRVLLMRISHQVLDLLQELQLEIGKKACQNLFLSDEEVASLRTLFTEPEPVETISKKERMSRLRKSLGFQDSKRSMERATGNEGEPIAEEDPESKASINSSDQTSNKASDADLRLKSDFAEAPRPIPENNHDLGQPVMSGTDDASALEAADAGISSIPTSRSGSPASSDMVKMFKESKKAKKEKKKDKRKASNKEPGGNKKKRKKKDFFDDLFA